MIALIVIGVIAGFYFFVWVLCRISTMNDDSQGTR
jgi:hypothetical protein